MHDAQLERELEVLHTEAESDIQFFYVYLTVHAVAANNQPVYRLLNKASLFWNTCLGALQTAAFIALGRIFDQNSTHNLDRLLRRYVEEGASRSINGMQAAACQRLRRAIEHGVTKRALLEALYAAQVPGGGPTLSIGAQALI